MKKLVPVWLFLALFSFGCSALMFTDQQISLQDALVGNTVVLAVRVDCMKRHTSETRDFCVYCNEDSPIDCSNSVSLPYKCLKLQISLPKLKEDKQYYVYWALLRKSLKISFALAFKGLHCNPFAFWHSQPCHSIGS